jgi:antitoxin HigA-1
MTLLNPIHPGEVLREEFLIPMSIDEERLARSTGVPLPQIREILSAKQSVTADIALRFGMCLGTSTQFWLGLQSDYDLDIAREILGNRLESEITLIAA